MKKEQRGRACLLQQFWQGLGFELDEKSIWAVGILLATTFIADSYRGGRNKRSDRLLGQKVRF